jgi:hypothetical protein
MVDGKSPLSSKRCAKKSASCCRETKGRILHPNPENLHLHAWLLSGRESDRKVFLSEQPTTSLRLSDSLE